MLRKLTAMISGENTGTQTIVGWISGFAGVVFTRLFLEQFSNQSPLGIIESDPKTFTHVFLFFLAITVSISLIVSLFTKQKGNKVITLALCGLSIIWLAPILDLLISGGGISSMAYMFETHSAILFNFFTFFGPIKTPGITQGLHIELFLSLCAIGWYVWNKRKNILFGIGAALVSYIFIFTALSLPGIIFTISHPFATEKGSPAVVSFMNETILNSTIHGNALHNTLAYKSTSRLLDIGFDTIISQLFFLISFITILSWSWYTHKDTFKKILRNARIERVLSYMSLLALGALYARAMTPVVFIWADWMGLTVLTLSWFSAWMYAVHTNDLYDIDIDTISNPNRPLPKKELSLQTMRDIGFGWLLLSLVGAYIVGYYPFFMSIVFTSAYYVYSAPPLRLKRVPMLSSFLISLACLATILAGFFFLSPDKMLATFPTLLVIGIIVVFTLSSNFRDLKDIEGDRKAGIQTIPVIFGAYGRQVVGALLALGFLFVPIFLSFYTLYLFAIPAAIIGYKLCVRQPYKEKYLFVLYFVFYAITILLTFFLLSLLK